MYIHVYSYVLRIRINALYEYERRLVFSKIYSY